MDRTSVVVLSGRSLFSEGVAARLRRHEDRLDLHVVGADHPDALDRVVAAKPSAVILDASDPEATRNCSLSQLLNALPDVRVVRLDTEHDHILLLTSEQRQAAAMADLIDFIRPPSATGDAD